MRSKMLDDITAALDAAEKALARVRECLIYAAARPSTTAFDLVASAADVAAVEADAIGRHASVLVMAAHDAAVAEAEAVAEAARLRTN